MMRHSWARASRPIPPVGVPAPRERLSGNPSRCRTCRPDRSGLSQAQTSRPLRRPERQDRDPPPAVGGGATPRLCPSSSGWSVDDSAISGDLASQLRAAHRCASQSTDTVCMVPESWRYQYPRVTVPRANWELALRGIATRSPGRTFDRRVQSWPARARTCASLNSGESRLTNSAISSRLETSDRSGSWPKPTAAMPFSMKDSASSPFPPALMSHAAGGSFCWPPSIGAVFGGVLGPDWSVVVMSLAFGPQADQSASRSLSCSSALSRPVGWSAGWSHVGDSTDQV